MALAVAVAIYVLFLKKGSDELLFKIPDTAASVLIINTKSLSTDLLFDYMIRDAKSKSRMKEFIPAWLKTLDWTKSGIGLPDKIALFSTEDTITSKVNLHFIMPISNAIKFHAFMDTVSSKLQLTVNKKRGMKWVYSKPTGFLIAWDNHFIASTKATDNTESQLNSLYHILNVSRDQSLMTDSCFSKGAKKKYDVFFYTAPYTHCPVKKLKVINANIHYLISFINFKDGELKATTEISAKAGSNLDNIFTNFKSEFPGLENDNKDVISIRTNVNPAAFRALCNQFRFMNVKTDHFPSLNAWDGRLNLLFYGTKTIENTFISYEYDNDFNKKEIRKVSQERVYDIEGAAGVRQTTLDFWWKLNPPAKDGTDTLLFKGGRFVLKRNGGFYIFYNKEFQKPKQQSGTLKNNIEIAVDYKRLSPILREMGMESKTANLDSLTIDHFNLSAYKQENIVVKTNITFADKDINAFFTLLEKGISLFR